MNSAPQPPEREAKLRAALAPFAKLAETWTVQASIVRHGPGYLLTLSNGERMCGIEAGAFQAAKEALADD